MEKTCIAIPDEFAMLVGRMFLRELSSGRRDSAIAYARALLVLIEDNHAG